MNCKYTIKNFRVFDEEGATFNLRPITILTGCNSSGKSSVVKSMILLESFLDGLKNDIEQEKKPNLSKYKLDFTKYPNSTLGNFSRCLHWDTHKDEIVFSYTVMSAMLGEEIMVKMSFSTDKDDDLNNGYLQEISFSKKDGSLIYKSRRNEDPSGNLNLIFNDFIRYSYGQYILSQYRKNKFEFEFGNRDKDTSIQINELLKENIKKFETEFGQGSFSAIKKQIAFIETLNRNHEQKGLIERFFPNLKVPESLEILQKTVTSNSLFFIPILDKIGDLSTDEAFRWLKNAIKDVNDQDILILMINKLEKSCNSSYKTFNDFFLAKENAFLKFQDSPYIKEIYGNIDNPCLFTNLYIYQDNYSYLSSNCIFDFELLGSNNIIKTEAEAKAEDRKSRKKWLLKKDADFGLLYELLMIISEKLGLIKNSNFCSIKTYPSTDMDFYYHPMLSMFNTYIFDSFENLLVYEIPQNILYINSSVTPAKRFYSLEENDEFSQLINRYFETKLEFSKNYDVSMKENNKTNSPFIPGSFINEWFKKFGIGDKVSLNVDSEGFGVTIRLHKNAADKKGSILSEQGYGITQIFTILLRTEIAIMETYNIKKSKFISSSIIMLEEPEVHLHPRFQSMLADVFVKAFKKYNIQFIIETHSEYLIRKLQTFIAKKEIQISEVSLIYLYDPDYAKSHLGTPQIKHIDFSDDGRLTSAFGTGFFDEADRLSMDLLTLKAKEQ